MSSRRWRMFVVVVAAVSVDLDAQGRRFQPDDLFRIERIGAIVWSPDGSRAAVERHAPGRWLDPSIPTADISVVDAATGKMREVSRKPADVIGFYRPVWSPDGRRMLFLSVGTDAIVRPWLWSDASGTAQLLPGLELHYDVGDPPTALWSDGDHAVFLLREIASPPVGSLYFAIQRGRNSADELTRAREGRGATVAVMESRGDTPRPRESAGDVAVRRVVSVNLNTRAIATLASGVFHRPSLSADRRTLTLRRENPVLRDAPMRTFFRPEVQGDAAYDAVNWGTEVVHINARTGAPLPAPETASPAAAVAPARPTMRVAQDDGATRLMLVRPGQPEMEIWRGNTWLGDISTGRSESFTYTSNAGEQLTAWVLYPPDRANDDRIPFVALVYPGTIYSARQPGAFELTASNFFYPQLLAALGYGVLLPSMPASDKPLQTDAIAELAAGVVPAVDALVARGIADPKRVAVVGHSAGGWATLGLIATTDRFRTAIASASYSNLVSLYGTFYGQYRYGDSGIPERAQLLRMLQFERGLFAAGAPPWEKPDGYRANSPLWRVAQVSTPLMMVHGDKDYIPVQQAEEMFTALYRRDQRVRLLRYAGEGHVLSDRANVLDFWKRVREWLEDTMRAEP